MGKNRVARKQILGPFCRPSAMAFLFSLALVLMSFPAFGQERTGGIAGTVSDPTGAVIPDVQITATNLSTGRMQSTTSGSDGAYRILQVEPGRYSVAFEKSGFAKYEIADAIVTVTIVKVGHRGDVYRAN